jgi:zinc finger protein
MNHKNAPSSDPLLSMRFYERTREQQAALGFLAEPEQPGEAVLPASAVEAISGGLQSEPHASVEAVAGRRAINKVSLLAPCVYCLV